MAEGGPKLLSTVARRLGLGRHSPQALAEEAERSAAAAAAAAYTTGDDTTSNAPRILVVDDDRDLRDLVAFKLRHAGFAVATAPDGTTALAMIRLCRPDLVILDIMMPGPSGIDVCRQLREDPATAAMPVILLTARTNHAFANAGLATGADRHMRKPFSPRELLDEVEALLDR